MSETETKPPVTGDDTNAGTSTPPADTTTAAAVEEVQESPWAKHGALIVAGAPKKMPPKGDRMVIVAENRLPMPELAQGEAVPDDFSSDDLEAAYPKGAAIYYGYATVADPENPDEEPRRLFGDDLGDGEVILMGDHVKQFSHEGLSKKAGWLSVGPGSPVYGAVNLAWQRGARDVKIVGLREDEIKTLRPWFNQISPEFDSLEYGG